MVRAVLVGLGALVVLGVPGCGGENAALDGAAYTGRQDRAVVSPQNAPDLFSYAWDHGTIPARLTGSSKPDAGSGVGPWWLAAVMPDPLLLHFKGVREEGGDTTAVERIVYGSGGGVLRLAGSFYADGTGRMATTFEGFDQGDGLTVDGVAEYEIVSVDAVTREITHLIIHLTDLSVFGQGEDTVVGGRITLRVAADGNWVNTVLDLDGRDHRRDEAFRYRDFSSDSENRGVEGVYQTLTGELFVGRYGGVSVVTLAPLVDVGGGAPGSGGPVLGIGLGQTAFRVFPEAAGNALVEVDGDGDGGFDYRERMPWQDLVARD